MNKASIYAITALGAIFMGIASCPLSAVEVDEVAENQEVRQWMEHVYAQYDLGMETTTYSAGDQCITDNFDDQMIDPMWVVGGDDGFTVEEQNGSIRISGQTNYPRRYSGASFRMQDYIPLQSFTLTANVLAASGTFFNHSLHRGRHFTFMAHSNNGNYVALQYWAGYYRISWWDGSTWRRKGTVDNAYGDETTNWYMWKIVYDHTTSQASVYVDDKQIGDTVTIDLGDSFRPVVGLNGFSNTWLDGHWDDLSVCFASSDTTPPELSVDPIDAQVLWPPNGKMVDVNIAGTANDYDSGLASVSIDVVDEYGEIEASRDGFGPISLKAWRKSKDADGRAYNVSVTALDNAGNSTITKFQIVVPHDVGM